MQAGRSRALSRARDPARHVAEVTRDGAELAGDALELDEGGRLVAGGGGDVLGAQAIALGDLGDAGDALAEAGAFRLLVAADAGDALGALGGGGRGRDDYVEGAEGCFG